MTGLFPGQAAIVTGGASNIGRAIAIALATEGAEVTILDIDGEGAGETVRRIEATGGVARAVVVDLAVQAERIAVLRHYLAERGPPQLVVHAANFRTTPDQTFFSVTGDVWDRTLGVGLDAGFSLGRVLGAAMGQSGVQGRFLFLTSLHAETPRNMPQYAATKAGLTMVMKEMARALGPHGIRVNALAPGYVPAGAASTLPDRNIPMRRTGRAEEIAAMAVVLLSDRFSSYVTGTTVVVDGGLSLTNWIPSRA